MPAARSRARACLTAYAVSFFRTVLARAVLPVSLPARARSTVRVDTPARAAPYRAEFSLWRRRLRGGVLRFVKQVMQPARYTACMGKRSPLAVD
jgi:hypothetical protein